MASSALYAEIAPSLAAKHGQLPPCLDVQWLRSVSSKTTEILESPAEKLARMRGSWEIMHATDLSRSNREERECV